MPRELREAASSTGDKANELRDRALILLKRTREALTTGRAGTRRGGARHRRRARQWQAIGIAGVTGLLLGLLISRR